MEGKIRWPKAPQNIKKNISIFKICKKNIHQAVRISFPIIIFYWKNPWIFTAKVHVAFGVHTKMTKKQNPQMVNHFQ